MSAETCTWTLDVDEWNSWATGCGNLFIIDDGTPKENDFRYCCYCGKPLIESKPEDGDDD